MHKICRICLKSDLLVSIYSPNFLVRPSEMIEKLNIFKVEESLSTLLCQSCLYRLLDAYNLKQLADSSEHRLRGYLTEVPPGVSDALNVGPVASAGGYAIPPNPISQQPSDASSMYDICGIFDVNSNDIVEVEAGDVEIDVSSLTRSEAGDMSDVFVGGDNTTSSFHNVPSLGPFQFPSEVVAKQANPTKRKQKKLKVPDTCEQCGKVFHYSGYLEAHRRVHTGEKPYECKFCARKFSQASNLVLHERTHTGERRFQCEICSNFFTTSSNLKAHRLTHLEYREFQCSDCERYFKTKRELRRHESIHKLIKDIVCKLCGKTFAKTCYLSAHMAVVHRRVRRHKCTECGKPFSSRSNLVSHMRTHSGEKPFQCKYCSWKFNQSSALGRHMKKHLKGSDTNEADSPKNSNYNSLISNFLQDDELLGDIPAAAPVNEATPGPLPPNYDFSKSALLDFSAQNATTATNANAKGSYIIN